MPKVVDFGTVLLLSAIDVTWDRWGEIFFRQTLPGVKIKIICTPALLLEFCDKFFYIGNILRQGFLHRQ